MLDKAEREALELSAKLYMHFSDLEQLHPDHLREAATAIHVIQNMIFARPAYREYLKDGK